MESDLILVTGATGYVGGRLLAALEGRGLRVRCLARRPEFLRPRAAPGTEVVQGDVRDPESLREALLGVGTAYYLVHSMTNEDRFVEEDRRAAEIFAEVAREQKVQRVIYLGGLGADEQLSPHLASRQEVGRILRQGGVPTVELRASVIIGSGSLSFEIIRALVERLPLMVTPRWTRVRTQPIAIEDVIEYLVSALDLEDSSSQVFEIGGADVVSYADLMNEYARQRGLRRWMVPVPVLTPRLSSLWLGLVTPVYARIGRHLIEGVHNETIVHDPSALEAFPVRPRGMQSAIERALRLEDEEMARSRWCDPVSAGGSEKTSSGSPYRSRLIDSRAVQVPVPPEQAFRPIQRIGGPTGWYHANRLWQLRGLLDLVVGGVGMRRGRSHPEHLRVGDPIDFWRVAGFEPGHLLLLAAEMKLPGRAWLQFEVDGNERGSSIRQTAIFDAFGVVGRCYWYALYPLHSYVFRGMLNAIAASSQSPRLRRP
jgi:uncharacterized protein YbjT (DUF2867 family)